ncbi:cytochrome b5-like isoform X1 [Rhynchophorus ferrugineus]|uniref:cytochrome b5-like isoform X1 n=1 Tax=Rhynchophorus ferrugineus TaxID=354439 RepID=UPI003FCDC6F2
MRQNINSIYCVCCLFSVCVDISMKKCHYFIRRIVRHQPQKPRDWKHPGGGDLITEFAGLDATKGFDDFGHSSDAKKQLKSFKIGEVVEEERAGKAKKKTEKKSAAVTITDSPTKKPQTRSCISIVTCGLCG